MSATSPPIAADYRRRVQAIYARHCPERATDSNITFLMDKYAGYEDEMIDALVEKYGPEPAADRGVAATPACSQPQQPLDDAEADLERRRAAFARDIAVAHAEDALRVQALAGAATLRARAAAKRSLLEADQLRDLLARCKARRDATEAAASADAVAHHRALMSLRASMYALQAEADPEAASAEELTAARARRAAAEADLVTERERVAALEELLRSHLALYPMTPVRQALRSSDPALLASLDVG